VTTVADQWTRGKYALPAYGEEKEFEVGLPAYSEVKEFEVGLPAYSEEDALAAARKEGRRNGRQETRHKYKC
jgi:hypothetical protein